MEIFFPEGEGNRFEIGEGAFSNCKQLITMNYLSNETAIDAYVFSGCTKLQNVEMPSGLETIRDGAFSECTGLTKVVIPPSVTEIGVGAFSGCTGLTKVVIPSSVTKIGVGAFSECTGLTKVVIPPSVKEIGVGAFSGCTGLTKVVILGSETTINEGAFSGCEGLTNFFAPKGNIQDQLLEKYADTSMESAIQDANKMIDNLSSLMLSGLYKSDKLDFNRVELEAKSIYIAEDTETQIPASINSAIDLYIKDQEITADVKELFDRDVIGAILLYIQARGFNYGKDQMDLARKDLFHRLDIFNKQDLFYKQLNKVLAKEGRQMDLVISQLCENTCYISEDNKVGDERQQGEDLKALSYLLLINPEDKVPDGSSFSSNIAARLLNYMKEDSGAEYLECEWHEVLGKIYGDPIKLGEVLREVYQLQKDNGINEALRLNAFSGESVPQDIKNIVQNVKDGVVNNSSCVDVIQEGLGSSPSRNKRSAGDIEKEPGQKRSRVGP